MWYSLKKIILKLGKDWKENNSKWNFQLRTHETDKRVSDLRIPLSRQGWLGLDGWISFWELNIVLACLYLCKSVSYQCSWCVQRFCPPCNCWDRHLAKHASCCFELISQQLFIYSVFPFSTHSTRRVPLCPALHQILDALQDLTVGGPSSLFN